MYLLIAFVVIDILFVIYIIRKRKVLTSQDRQKYLRHWQDICNEHDRAKAVLEADKLLSILLRVKGYTGSVGSKLKAAETLFTDLDSVWYEHKMRNKVAHDMGHRVSEKDWEKASRGFKRAFKDLGLFK